MNAAIQQLQFENTRFDTVERDGETWLRLPQIGVALGYANPYKLLQVFERNASEFNHSMTTLLKLPTAGGEQTVRVFSLRGAHLLGMFARTPKAAAFRHWVLDVLEAAAKGQPAPSATDARLDRVIGLLEKLIEVLPVLIKTAAGKGGRRRARPMYVADLAQIKTMKADGAVLGDIVAATGFSQTQIYYVLDGQVRTTHDGRVVLVHRMRQQLAGQAQIALQGGAA